MAGSNGLTVAGVKNKSASHITVSMWQECSKEEVSDLPGLDWEPAATYIQAVVIMWTPSSPSREFEKRNVSR